MNKENNIMINYINVLLRGVKESGMSREGIEDTEVENE